MIKYVTTLILLTLTVLLLSGLGCSKGDNPIEPSGLQNDLTLYKDVDASEVHNLLLFNYLLIDATDESNIEYEIVPVRAAEKHWNILKFLEDGPCTNCFKIMGITPSGSGTMLVDINISGPFSNPNFTGFDVRGIAMFKGNLDFPTSGKTVSDKALNNGEIINADGYTSLYNATTLGSGPGGLEGYKKGKFATATAPDSDVNPYKRFVSTSGPNTRNAFFAGDSITVTYEVKMPVGPFIMGYAVDASYAPPTNSPVTDPMTDFPPEANSPEPYRIVAAAGSINPLGDATVNINVYDWQGKTSHGTPELECPALFNGIKMATFASDGADHSKWVVTIANEKSAPAGSYKCLIRVEDNTNDPGNKPWLDLYAYQIVEIKVVNEYSLVDVTPPQLNLGAENYEVVGNNLIVSAGHTGIQIFDISNPINPLWDKNVKTDYYVWQSTYTNGYLYVADQSSFGIIDFDPVDSATYVKKVYTPSGSPFAIASEGTNLFVAAATYPDGNFYVYDISDPENPALAATIPFTGFPMDIKVKNGYAYFTASAGGFYVIDVEPAASASIVTNVAIPGYAYGVKLDGDYAYVAGYGTGVHIVDINPPALASLVNSVDTDNWAVDLAVRNGYVYVADYQDTFVIVDVDPPGAAFKVGTVSQPTTFTVAEIFGNYLVAGGLGGTFIYDITTPVTPVLKREINRPGSAYDIKVSGNKGLLANQGSGALVLNTNNPAVPFVAKKLDTGPAYQVDIVGDTGYVLSYNGLSIIDMPTPATSSILTTVPYFSSLNELTVVDGYAYVAGGNEGLVIFDVDPVATASVAKTVSTPFPANGVAVDGGYAYVSGVNYPDGAVYVVDVDPVGTASIVGTLALNYEPSTMRKVGNYVYLAHGSNGLSTINVTNPASPTLVTSTVFTGNSVYEVDYEYGDIFAMDYSYGLDAVSISNPESPTLLKNGPSIGFAMGLDVEGNYAYLACSGAGIRILRLY